ncbi:NAD-dependent epimerase/dehydratase family protein [Vibrio caribbeanicus]|uniref:Putative epimerase/dehydratase WbiG n=1 Tax=Vibrio caribbeanicus ATCC BAA-2122 TaxID=796620 RepID=E3BJ65_9VIBR|nr:NAD-dependent epimerase/dehydratase family protein [Vibrio caribbeanicus]EFP96991.1 putative epimerase/dehydratase WbiG [Vibrio caribbeanicus ATCC BAA-2122]
MKTLITGASGFIGSEVVKSRAARFRLVSRNLRSNPIETDESDIFYVESIDSSTDWTGAFGNIDSVLHLAGLAHNKDSKPADYDEVNFLGTIRLAQEAQKQGVKRFVFVSTIGVLGRCSKEGPLNRFSSTAPYDCYSKSKLKAERALQELASKGSMELVIVRPTLVYGAHAPGNFQKLVKLVNLSPILPFGLANNRRSFISVYNLSDLLLRCLTHEQAAGHIFHACEQEPISTKDFVNKVAKGLNKSLIQAKIPPKLMKVFLTCIGKKITYDQLFGDLEVDGACSQKTLNWSPPYTIDESMKFLRNTND